MIKKFPLLNYKETIPEGDHPGAYGFRRKFDVHTGIDLYCQENEEVFSIESGVVVEIFEFTGDSAGSPWWHPTKAVAVSGDSGIILYGEINPLVKVGDTIKPGDLIGSVLTVLKKDKGRPMAMLHLELYSELMEPVIWNLDEVAPKGLLDPTSLLKEIK